MLWEDFNLGAVDESKRLQLLAYYYNAADGWGKEVVATYKDGYNNKGEVFDYERGGPGDIVTPYWLTDDTVSSQSWCFVTGMPYHSDTQIVHSFIDRVSKGGHLLLNISPMPDGTIPQRQKDILNAMGTFLEQNGAALYNTRAWKVYGEGPTKMGGGAFTAPTAGTAQDIRYTASQDGDALYAIVLGWPGNGQQITLANVTRANFDVGAGQVYLFAPVGGSEIGLAFTHDGSGLHVTLPETQPYTAIAYAMKISKSGKVPESTPVITTPPPPDSRAPDDSAPDSRAPDDSAPDDGAPDDGARRRHARRRRARRRHARRRRARRRRPTTARPIDLPEAPVAGALSLTTVVTTMGHGRSPACSWSRHFESRNAGPALAQAQCIRRGRTRATHLAGIVERDHCE